MTASPTHPRTGEPETEAGRELLDMNPKAAIEFWPVLWRMVAAIEAEAAKRERDRGAILLEILADHLDGFHGECHCRRKIDDALPAEGSPDPVPDEPPGVDPFDSRDASHVDGLSGRERADLRDEPPGVATWMHGK